MARSEPVKKLSQLMWTMEDTDTCTSSGEALSELDVELTINGVDDAHFAVSLQYGARSGIAYAPTMMLLEMVREIGCRYGDIEGFSIDGKEMQTGVLISEGELAPWTEFRKFADVALNALRDFEYEEAVLPEAGVTSEVWQVTCRPHSWMEDEDGGTSLAYLSVMVDNAGMIRGFDMEIGKPDVERCIRMIGIAALGESPSSSETGYPRQLIVNRDLHVGTVIAAMLAERNVEVTIGETPLADEAIEATLNETGGTIGDPYFSGRDPDEIRAYFAAAGEFFQASPWTEIEPDLIIAFQRTSGDWFFGNVMGRGGQDFGLAIFHQWIDACYMLQQTVGENESEIAHKLAEVTTGLETASLCPGEALHPKDFSLLKKLGIPATADGEYLVPMRFTGEGASVPLLDLETYIAALKFVVGLMKIPFEDEPVTYEPPAGTGGLKLAVYPADGEQGLAGDLPAMRFRIPVSAGVASTAVGDGDLIEIEAHSTLPMGDFMEHFSDQFTDGERVELHLAELPIWWNHGNYWLPEPRVANLYGRDDLELVINGEKLAVMILPTVQNISPGYFEIRINGEKI